MSLRGFLAERKVAEQRPEGRESALDTDLYSQEHRVADPHRSVGSGHGALRTTPALEGGLELGDVTHAEHLADVGAGRALAVHAQREPADAELGADGERGEAGETLRRDLLAQIAGLQTERLVCRAVDDDDGALYATGVRIALETTADTTDSLLYGTRVLAVPLVQVQSNDPRVHL